MNTLGNKVQKVYAANKGANPPGRTGSNSWRAYIGGFIPTLTTLDEKALSKGNVQRRKEIRAEKEKSLNPSKTFVRDPLFMSKKAQEEADKQRHYVYEQKLKAWKNHKALESQQQKEAADNPRSHVKRAKNSKVIPPVSQRNLSIKEVTNRLYCSKTLSKMLSQIPPRMEGGDYNFSNAFQNFALSRSLSGDKGTDMETFLSGDKSTGENVPRSRSLSGGSGGKFPRSRSLSCDRGTGNRWSLSYESLSPLRTSRSVSSNRESRSVKNSKSNYASDEDSGSWLNTSNRSNISRQRSTKTLSSLDSSNRKSFDRGTNL